MNHKILPVVRSAILLFMISLLGLSPVASNAENTKPPLKVQLISPAGHSNNDYIETLLALALQKSGEIYQLSETLIDVEQGREINIVMRHTGKVISCGTSAQFERDMRPIRIPLYRGMLGYRIGIINKNRQPEFSAVRTLDDLRRMTIGQGINWSDIRILEAAGFKVITADYQMLFKMVARNRFDCFLRGINEAFDEVESYGKENPELAVEESLALYYPFAMFFFVNKNDKRLAEAIEKGLTAAYDDESFMTLFATHPQTRDVLEKAKLKKRRLFKIDNPTMTEETSAIPEQYWLKVD